MGIEGFHNQRIQALIYASPLFAGLTIYQTLHRKSTVFFGLFHFFCPVQRRQSLIPGMENSAKYWDFVDFTMLL
jgi:hypothetical protein